MTRDILAEALRREADRKEYLLREDPDRYYTELREERGQPPRTPWFVFFSKKKKFNRPLMVFGLLLWFVLMKDVLLDLILDLF